MINRNYFVAPIYNVTRQWKVGEGLGSVFEIQQAYGEVDLWVKTLPIEWGTKKILKSLKKLSVPARVIIGCGDLLKKELEYVFYKPSVDIVMQESLEQYDSCYIVNGVKLNLTIEQKIKDSDGGYYIENITRRIATGDFRKEGA